MSASLEEYLDGTTGNARSTLQNHPKHVAVLRRINETFDHVLGYLTSNPDSVVIFTAMAHSDFLAATRLALSGELPASFAVSRACIEDALYAFFLFRNPQLKKVWAARHESEEAKKRVRKEFTVIRMKETLITYLEKVGKQIELVYETTIDMGAHPNVMKVFANLSEHPGKKPEWQYINLADVDVAIALRSVAMSGLAALNTFKLVWPLTFSSTSGSDLVQDIHELFLGLPIPADGAV